MDRAASHPLTLEQAKSRLRDVAARTQASALESLEPRRTMLTALVAGVLLGAEPGSRRALAKILAGLLFD